MPFIASPMFESSIGEVRGPKISQLPFVASPSWISGFGEVRGEKNKKEIEERKKGGKKVVRISIGPFAFGNGMVGGPPYHR